MDVVENLKNFQGMFEVECNETTSNLAKNFPEGYMLATIIRGRGSFLRDYPNGKERRVSPPSKDDKKATEQSFEQRMGMPAKSEARETLRALEIPSVMEERYNGILRKIDVSGINFPDYDGESISKGWEEILTKRLAKKLEEYKNCQFADYIKSVKKNAESLFIAGNQEDDDGFYSDGEEEYDMLGVVSMRNMDESHSEEDYDDMKENNDDKLFINTMKKFDFYMERRVGKNIKFIHPDLYAIIVGDNVLDDDDDEENKKVMEGVLPRIKYGCTKGDIEEYRNLFQEALNNDKKTFCKLETPSKKVEETPEIQCLKVMEHIAEKIRRSALRFSKAAKILSTFIVSEFKEEEYNINREFSSKVLERCVLGEKLKKSDANYYEFHCEDFEWMIDIKASETNAGCFDEWSESVRKHGDILRGFLNECIHLLLGPSEIEMNFKILNETYDAKKPEDSEKIKAKNRMKKMIDEKTEKLSEIIFAEIKENFWFFLHCGQFNGTKFSRPDDVENELHESYDRLRSEPFTRTYFLFIIKCNHICYNFFPPNQIDMSSAFLNRYLFDYCMA
jgi:hypothetical protein